mmetsp:Transcript_52252/g.60999  ORF Transcript_52252/g.60999 Transcript_52252/m.60999 type:complete len:100 (+) Transcript_52252:677-976(+)
MPSKPLSLQEGKLTLNGFVGNDPAGARCVIDDDAKGDISRIGDIEVLLLMLKPLPITPLPALLWRTLRCGADDELFIRLACLPCNVPDGWTASPEISRR